LRPLAGHHVDELPQAGCPDPLHEVLDGPGGLGAVFLALRAFFLRITPLAVEMCPVVISMPYLSRDRSPRD
jgi:hypothetical protein